jgi:hypothetical protein
MRPPIKHIAALLTMIFLETHLLWKLDCSPYSPSEFLATTLARLLQDLHTPFALVRLYRQTTARRRPYQAPLIQPEGEVLPHSYGVHLHPGYSVEAHKCFVGAAGDLRRHIAFEYRHELGYRAEGLDEAMLRAVRADVGVDWVEMGCMVGGADPNEGDYDEFQRKLDVAMLLEELLGPEWEDEVPSCPGLFADLRVKKLHSLFFLVFARMVKLPLPEEPIRSRASPSHSVPGMPDGSKN